MGRRRRSSTAVVDDNDEEGRGGLPLSLSLLAPSSKLLVFSREMLFLLLHLNMGSTTNEE